MAIPPNEIACIDGFGGQLLIVTSEKIKRDKGYHMHLLFWVTALLNLSHIGSLTTSSHKKIQLCHHRKCAIEESKRMFECGPMI